MAQGWPQQVQGSTSSMSGLYNFNEVLPLQFELDQTGAGGGGATTYVQLGASQGHGGSDPAALHDTIRTPVTHHRPLYDIHEDEKVLSDLFGPLVGGNTASAGPTQSDDDDDEDDEEEDEEDDDEEEEEEEEEEAHAHASRAGGGAGLEDVELVDDIELMEAPSMHMAPRGASLNIEHDIAPSLNPENFDVALVTLPEATYNNIETHLGEVSLPDPQLESLQTIVRNSPAMRLRGLGGRRHPSQGDMLDLYYQQQRQYQQQQQQQQVPPEALAAAESSSSNLLDTPLNRHKLIFTSPPTGGKRTLVVVSPQLRESQKKRLVQTSAGALQQQQQQQQQTRSRVTVARSARDPFTVHSQLQEAASMQAAAAAAPAPAQTAAGFQRPLNLDRHGSLLQEAFVRAQQQQQLMVQQQQLQHLQQQQQLSMMNGSLGGGMVATHTLPQVLVKTEHSAQQDEEEEEQQEEMQRASAGRRLRRDRDDESRGSDDTRSLQSSEHTRSLQRRRRRALKETTKELYLHCLQSKVIPSAEHIVSSSAGEDASEVEMVLLITSYMRLCRQKLERLQQIMSHPSQLLQQQHRSTQAAPGPRRKMIPPTSSSEDTQMSVTPASAYTGSKIKRLSRNNSESSRLSATTQVASPINPDVLIQHIVFPWFVMKSDGAVLHFGPRLALFLRKTPEQLNAELAMGTNAFVWMPFLVAHMSKIATSQGTPHDCTSSPLPEGRQVCSWRVLGSSGYHFIILF